MRLQLALNVRNIDEAVDYYSKLFGATPHKRRPGYANFALDAPPLKLVLFENPEAAERLNHLGVEVFEQGQIDEAYGDARTVLPSSVVRPEGWGGSMSSVSDLRRQNGARQSNARQGNESDRAALGEAKSWLVGGRARIQ